MRLRIASSFVLAALACRPEPGASTSPVSTAGSAPSAPVGPAIPVGSAVMVRAGGTVWLDATRTQPIELPERMPGEGIAMIVVTDHGATLEVDTATSTACASPLVGDFALRLFVAKSDLRAVARAPIDREVSAKFRAQIAAGAPVDGEAGNRSITVGVGNDSARIPIPDSEVGDHVPPPLGKGPCVELQADGKPSEASIGDPGIWAALVQANVGHTGATHYVRKGAKVWWRDGSSAGTVAHDHTFHAAAAVAGTRSCLPLQLADDNTTTLCFETKDLTEGTSGSGTIGLGNVGIIGKGGDDDRFGMKGSIPRVRQAKATVTGALDKDIVRRIVRAHINEISHCYNQALIRNPDAKGRITIDATIDETGAVVSATPQPSGMDDAELGGCMAKAFLRWKFPKPTDGDNVTVSYPFILEPE